jgi:glutamyl-tRNA synthetase
MSSDNSSFAKGVRVRVAPSPTGMPHIGLVRTALFNWLLRQRFGGSFILRIEDTDRNRFVEGATDEIMHALRWAGLDWDEGPDKGGKYGPYLQSERLDIYQKHVQILLDNDSAYKCYCTPERLEKLRETQQERGLPTGYDRRCRFLSVEDRAKYESDNAPFTIRFKAPREGNLEYHDLLFGDMNWECRILEDAILLKTSGWPTYHLAAIVDDHLMEITHIIRGEEWLPSLPMHVLTFKAFGWEVPQYIHTTSILGPNRKKLSKRDASAEFSMYEKEGYLPEALINFMALMGWTPDNPRDLYTTDELIELFSIDGLIGHPAILDPDKILWYNGVYIRALDKGDLAKRCLPFLQEAGLVSANPTSDELAYIGEVIALEQERIKTLAECVQVADFFLLSDTEYVFDEKAVAKWFTQPEVAERLKVVRDIIASQETITIESAEAAVRSVIEKFEVKNGEVIHPVRVAVTGRTTGPGLFESMAVLGKTRLLARFDRALTLF